MKGKLSTISLLGLLFIISSCGSVTIHDSKVCTVSGRVIAGANCVSAVSGTKTQLDFDQLIDMLEPSEAEDRAGAVIIPFNDFIEIKKQTEQACVYLRCKKKSLKIIKNVEKLYAN